MFSIANFFKDKPKGLVLPEYKSLSNHSGEIQLLPLYQKYYVSLLQRDGNMAVPTISIGERVRCGDVVARPTSNIALHRHAPTSGEVTAIVDIRETHPSGMTVKALEITADGKDTQTNDFPVINDYLSADRKVLIERIFRAGIAGMGGAGFPTEKKINLNQPVETLIINGAECEPYITCDDILMRHYAAEIIRGALIFARILRSSNILIGIEDNKPQAIAAMRAAVEIVQAESDCHLGVHVLPTQYPMGSRHQIAHYLLGKRPNITKRSYQSGFICHNVATAKAVFDAVALGKPLTERLVTFSGDGLEKPGVYRAKCGSNIADIAGDVGLREHLDEVIIGGTMMGFSVPTDFDSPLVIKRETISVLAFSNRPQHTLIQETQEENCIRCGQCADVCPMDLLPQQLHFYSRGDDHEKLAQNRLFDCIECGLCNYVCPSNIPLVQVFQHSKGDILAERKSQQDAEHARIRFETRNARLEAEKAEKARKAAERRAKLKAQATAANDGNDKQDLIAKALANRKRKATAVGKSDKSDLIAAAVARSQAKKAVKKATGKPGDTDSKDSKQAAVAEALAKRKAEKTADKNNSDKQDLIAAAIARSQAKKTSKKATGKTVGADSKDSKQAAVAEVLAKRKAEKTASKDNSDKQDLIAAAIARSQAKKAAQKAANQNVEHKKVPPTHNNNR